MLLFFLIVLRCVRALNCYGYAANAHELDHPGRRSGKLLKRPLHAHKLYEAVRTDLEIRGWTVYPGDHSCSSAERMLVGYVGGRFSWWRWGKARTDFHFVVRTHGRWWHKRGRSGRVERLPERFEPAATLRYGRFVFNSGPAVTACIQESPVRTAVRDGVR